MNGMTVQQAARVLGVGERQILYYIRDGLLDAERFGERVWQVDAESVRRFEKRPVGRPRKSEPEPLLSVAHATQVVALEREQRS